jgi:integrase/recombinase XerD
MSVELRKVIFRWYQKRSAVNHYPTVAFCAKQGTQLSARNFLRDFKELCGKLGITGIRCSPHTLRHTFAVGCLRAGGNLFYLSKILEHSSVTTTQRYLQSLEIEDLQAVHSRLSLHGNGHA